MERAYSIYFVKLNFGFIMSGASVLDEFFLREKRRQKHIGFPTALTKHQVRVCCIHVGTVESPSVRVDHVPTQKGNLPLLAMDCHNEGDIVHFFDPLTGDTYAVNKDETFVRQGKIIFFGVVVIRYWDRVTLLRLTLAAVQYGTSSQSHKERSWSLVPPLFAQASIRVSPWYPVHLYNYLRRFNRYRTSLDL